MPTDAQRETNTKIVTNERTYRRGFHHGVKAILNAIDNDATMEDLSKFSERVKAWRYGPGFPIDPPVV